MKLKSSPEPKLAHVPLFTEVQRLRFDAAMQREKQNPQPHLDRLTRQEATLRQLEGAEL